MADILLPFMFYGREFAASRSEHLLLHEQTTGDVMFARVGECGRFLCISSHSGGPDPFRLGNLYSLVVGCRNSMAEDYRLETPFKAEAIPACWRCLCKTAGQLHSKKVLLNKSCEELVTTNGQ